MSKFIPNKKYHYLIVPCPGNPMFVGDKVEFSNLESDKHNSELKLFLGAEDRMRAAIIKSRDAEKIVLVGGSESKVLAMYIYFKQQIKKEENKKEIICLVSTPDSTGNFSAFRKYLKKNQIDVVCTKLAIISNEYHLPRLKLIWDSLFDKNFIVDWFSEVEILKIGLAKDIYEKELANRINKEEAGRRDWVNQQYNGQEDITTWNPDAWKCKELDLKFEEK
ncbi:MAG: hypothetical protein PHR00_04645 [Patescibacteria group bacterium]|nr:hypothetical protein [Patescibacteria group bacterium]